MIVQVNFTVKWQFKDYTNYKVTTCKKIVNCQRGRFIKCTKNGGSIGYFVAGAFYKKSDINKHIELIPKIKTPF
tara:strand:+ start:229 stop:450 length:222 start_codon:yes stop_codon:yes gene_type:complete